MVKLYQDELKQEDEDLADSFKLNFKLVKRPRAKCPTQFRMICKRNVGSIKRNPLVFKARMG